MIYIPMRYIVKFIISVIIIIVLIAAFVVKSKHKKTNNDYISDEAKELAKTYKSSGAVQAYQKKMEQEELNAVINKGYDSK